MAACAALCIGLLPQMAGLSSGGGNSTGAAPASASESQAASSTPAPVPMLPAGSPPPLPRSAPAMRAVRKPRTPPRWRRSPPPPSLPSPCRNRSGRTGGLLRPCPRPVRSPGRTAGPESRPAAPVLHHSRGTGGPGLAGDGRLSLDRPGSGGGPLPAGRPDRPGRRPVGERGGGPRSGSGVSLNLTSALDRRDLRPVQGSFLLFFVGEPLFLHFCFILRLRQKRGCQMCIFTI